MGDNIILLERSSGCAVKVHLYGATVISWLSSGTERLFLSSTSKMDGSKAIRGGIPVVFPNFGPWANGPQHGFARISWWKVSKQPEKMANGNVTAELELSDNEATRKMWNFSFTLLYKLTLEESSFTTELQIKNTGNSPFDFTTLLHTYIKVSDIDKTSVSGFENCIFTDKVAGTENNKETRKDVTIDCNVDRVYKLAGAGDGHTVITPEARIHIQKTNMPDTVLWNPWKEKAAAMSDFNDSGYVNMVCVEAGYVSERKVLQPSKDFICSQKLTVL